MPEIFTEPPSSKEIFNLCFLQTIVTFFCEILLFLFLSSTITPVVIVSRLPADFVKMSETDKINVNDQIIRDLTEELKDEEKKKNITLEYNRILVETPSLLLLNSAIWSFCFLLPGYFIFIKKLNHPAPDLSMELNPNVLLYGLWVGFVIFMWIGLLSVFLKIFDYNPPVPEFQKLLFTSLKDNNYLLGWGIYTIGIVTGLIEELFFRGFLLTQFKKIGASQAGLFFTSVLFGILHYSPEVSYVNPFFITMVGYILGITYLRTGNLWVSIFGHATYNSLGLLTAYFAGDKIL